MVRYRAGKRSLIVSAAAVACVWLSSPRSAADDDVAAHGVAHDALGVSGTGATTERKSAVAKRATESKPKSSRETKSQETRANAATQAPELDVHAALLHGRREGAKWVASAGADRRVELTLLPGLQEKAREIFSSYRVPYAAVAAIEPSSGRLLAYLGHSLESPVNDPVRDTSPPAASVFKIVTASALVDSGVPESTRTCFSGGASRLDMVNLKDNPRRDAVCATLDEALGKSLNCVFAKLADKHLDAAKLHSYARAFGFGNVLPFDFAPPASPLEVPGERLEFARTAAGFWHTHMSTLHAALIAGTIANDGAMPFPYAVERVTDADGTKNASLTNALGERSRHAPRRVISPATAHAVGHMMLRTVTDGTSRSAFLDSRGRALLPGISVAGKTGSLSANNPYKAYSWWVGFAPADKPKIALAVLVVNQALWRIKSSFVARELLREYFSNEARPRTEVVRQEAHAAVGGR